MPCCWILTTSVTSLVGVSSILLTVTGFVVSLGLSFRNSSAYERYMEGRKYWAQLIMSSNCLARVFWIHAKNRPDNKEKDMLAKLWVLPVSWCFVFGARLLTL